VKSKIFFLFASLSIGEILLLHIHSMEWRTVKNPEKLGQNLCTPFHRVYYTAKISPIDSWRFDISEGIQRTKKSYKYF